MLKKLRTRFSRIIHQGSIHCPTGESIKFIQSHTYCQDGLAIDIKGNQRMEQLTYQACNITDDETFSNNLQQHTLN